MSISPFNSRQNSDDEDLREPARARPPQPASRRIIAPFHGADDEYAAQLRAAQRSTQTPQTTAQRMTTIATRPNLEIPPPPAQIPAPQPAADLEASVDQVVRSVTEQQAPRSLAADVDPDSVAPSSSRTAPRTPAPPPTTTLGPKISFSGRSGISSSYNYSSNSSLGGRPAMSSIAQRTQTQLATVRPLKYPVEREAGSIGQLLYELSVGIASEENPLLWFRKDPIASRFTDVWSDYVRAGTNATEAEKTTVEAAEEALEKTITAVYEILDMLGVQRTDLLKRASETNTQALIAKFTVDCFLCTVPELKDMALVRKAHNTAQEQNKEPEEILQDERVMQTLRRNMERVDREECTKIREWLASVLESHANVLKPPSGPVPGDKLYAVALIQLAPNNPEERDDAWRVLTNVAKTKLMNEAVLNSLVMFAFLAVDTALAAAEDANQELLQRTEQLVMESISDITNALGGAADKSQTLDQTQQSIIGDIISNTKRDVRPLAADFATIVKVFVGLADVGNLTTGDKLIAVMNIIMEMYPDFVVESYVNMTPGSRGVPSSAYIPPRPEPRQEEQRPAPPQVWQPSPQELSKLLERARQEQEAAVYQEQVERSDKARDEATEKRLLSEERRALLDTIPTPQWPLGLYLCLTRANGGVFSAPAKEDYGYPSGNPDTPEEYTADTRGASEEIRAYARLAAVITARLVMLGSDAKAAAARIVFLGGVAVALFFDESITVNTHNEDQLSGEEALWYAINDIEEFTIEDSTARDMLARALSIEITTEEAFNVSTEEGFVACMSVACTEGLGITPGRLIEAPNHEHLVELLTGVLFKKLDELVPLTLFFPTTRYTATLEGNTSERLRLFRGSELLYLLPGGSFGGNPVFTRDITEPDLVPANALLRTPAHTAALLSFLEYVYIMLNNDISEGEWEAISAVLGNAKTAMQTLKMVEKLNAWLAVTIHNNKSDYTNLHIASPYEDTAAWLLSVMETFAADDAETHREDVARWALMDAYLELTGTTLEETTVTETFFKTALFSRIAVRFAMEHTGGTSQTLWPTRVYRIIPVIAEGKGFQWGSEDEDTAAISEETPESAQRHLEEEVRSRSEFGAF